MKEPHQRHSSSAREAPGPGSHTQAGSRAQAGSLTGEPQSSPCSDLEGDLRNHLGSERAALFGRGERELLVLFVKSDPWGLRGVVHEFLAAEGLLLDENRLFLRSAARAAHDAALEVAVRPAARPTEETLDAWIHSRVDAAVQALLVEDKEALECGVPPTESWDPVAPCLLERLPIEPGLARAVAVTFNRLPVRERRIFHSLVIRGDSLDECATQTRMSPQSLRSVVRDVLYRLCRLDRGERPRGERPEGGQL